MIEPSPLDEQRAADESKRLAAIDAAGPTWRQMVDAFGEESLWVEARGSGLLVRGCVLPDGTVFPRGVVRFKVCRPDLSPEVNQRRLKQFGEMMKNRRAMQAEDITRRDEETDHKFWTDSDGVKRVAPAEHEELQRKKDEARKKVKA